jgi:SpoVK/Ycf46/Vps4 family AAA+-type ATPase
MLRDVPLAPDFPVRFLAEHAKGKSGSDLKEMCRSAAMLPVREFVRKANGDISHLALGQEVRLDLNPSHFRRSVTRCITQGFNLRPLTIEDFIDPDGASTTIDSELDHVESVEPLD